MSLSDELAKLQDLHSRGALTDDEFVRAKSRLLDDTHTPQADRAAPAPVLAAVNGLRRSRSDRWIAGVCGGIAKASGIESWVLRLLGVVLLLFGGAGLLIYVLLWIFVPDE